MSERYPYEEITILIPGYSVEDLPSDLAEEPAESLLNAFAAAWHPVLIAKCGGIPRFRHADSVQQLSGRHILLVPLPTEDWMPHEWQGLAVASLHTVLNRHVARSEWLAAIDQLDAGSSTTDGSLPGPRGAAVLVDEFMAFGTVYLMVILLSRRMHHFVDPDESTLKREITAAAAAAVEGDADKAAMHLKRCFELLHETREQFFPPECFLVDLCVPAARQNPSELVALLQKTPRINLIASGTEIECWAEENTDFTAVLSEHISSGTVCLLTGHMAEVRPALCSPSVLLEDMRACRNLLQSLTATTPQQWARRRFGLQASLPLFLKHMGFQFACHFALDDGIYPDRERSQFDWQSADGSVVAATSRIPVAVESASSVLKLPDRLNESMQDDTSACVFLARLPNVDTPWLNDLRRSSAFAPVLGEFVTIPVLTERSASWRNRLKFEHGEYLSPALIQSAVLRTESPVSGPAQLFTLWEAFESLSMLLGLAVLMRAGTSDQRSSLAGQLNHLIRPLLKLEADHADPTHTDAEQLQQQEKRGVELFDQLKELQLQLATLLKSRLPQREESSRHGCLLLNTLPFSRSCLIRWNGNGSLPARHSAIDAVARSGEHTRVLLQLPPGGFVWLTQAGSAEEEAEVLVPARRERPLAEHMILRNRHFELSLSDRHGGIESVVFHGTRPNRFSQQIAFRFEREQHLQADEESEARSTWYATSRLLDARILEAGPLLGELETLVEIVSPADGRVMAACRQITSVDRFRSQIRIRLVFESIEEAVRGNPWMTYFCCRFAWDDENAAISRSVLGQTAGFRGERFESPDFFEVADDQHRFVVVTHGRPWHRRSGNRMLDSLLICEGEPAREFQFTIDFDQPVPARVAQEAMVPVIELPADGTMPNAASSGWLLGLTARNVLLASVRTMAAPDAVNSAERIRLTLIETEGVASNCMVRTARRPQTATQLNADESKNEELPITDQGASVSLQPFQLQEVELSFGQSAMPETS